MQQHNEPSGVLYDLRPPPGLPTPTYTASIWQG